MLASNIHLGAVYFDPTVGDDSVANTIQVSFEGGDSGTELKQIIIDGDKLGDGQLTLGDVFFDTAPGGMGAFLSAPVQIQPSQNFTVTNVSISDGGMKLIIDLDGFTAGDVLTLTVDVDEMGLFNPNSLAEGAEFEGSKLAGTFEAPHYLDAQGSAIFYDAYDSNFAAAAAANGSTLKLPNDSYAPPSTVDQSDHTAGAVASIIQVPKPISIAGTVYEDLNLNNDQNGAEPGIGGVKLELFKLQNGSYVSTGKTTTTDAQGHYKFEGPDLLPGTYRVVETQPAGFFSVGAQPGTIDGTTVGQVDSPNVLSQITVLGGQDSVENNFGEARPASLSGVVYHDHNNNGLMESGDEGIGGVTIQVIPVSTIDGSTAPIITTTNSDGSWAVTGLAPGTYRVVEIQPAAYIDGIDTPGNAGGTAVNPGDQINGIVLAPGQAGINYKFGEYKPGTISGRVHADLDGDCEYDPGEPLLSGVTVKLLDQNGNVIATTQTNAQGEYEFTGLAPGTYGVQEVQPAGYYDDDEHPGSAGGVVTADDRIEQIVIGSGVQAVHYDFCELLPASISGRVHADLDGDCEYDPGEPLLSGVTIKLLDSSGNVIATTQTNAQGEYEFTGLKPGTYGIQEVQPAGYFDDEEHPGSAGGAVTANDRIEQIVLGSGVQAVHYDFCELLPASISGRVHADLDGDCEYDPGEPLLAGVTIKLLDSSGNVIATTQTNAQGEYEFTGLEPGTYGIQEVQPAGYFDDEEHPGSAGGGVTANDRIEQIVLGSGVQAVHYDFCEEPPATISGYVFQDGDAIASGNNEPPADISTVRDGLRTSDDTPIAGVVLQLRDGVTGEVIDGSSALPGTYGPGPITAVTDANGHYVFTGLKAGSYSVFEVQPADYFDAIDTPGTTGGVALNRHAPVDPSITDPLVVNPNNDAILRIPVTAGQHSQENNFSEVTVRPFFNPPPPSELPPPPPIFNPEFFIPPVNPVRPEPYLLFENPQDIRGVAPVTWYTWHLSVTNAGQPRAVNNDSGVAMLYTSPLIPVSVTDTALDGATWSLYGDDGAPQQFVFGAPNGRPVAGDFNGDGKSEIGVYIDGQWFIDLNGNGVWDAGDLWAKLGSEKDRPVVGDWDGDGKDDIGIYGPAWAGDPRAIRAEPGIPDPYNEPKDRAKNLPPKVEEATLGKRDLKIGLKGKLRSDLIDHVFNYGTPKDVPVVGDWNGDGVRTIGVFRDGTWYLDVNGDGRFDENDRTVQFGQAGDIPVVGDWNGKGKDQVGVFRQGKWLLDSNGNGSLDASDKVFELGGADDLPVVGDWNGDGIDKPAVYHRGTTTRISARP